MNVEVKPGARLRSSVCTTEVIVVRAPKGPLDLRCGGEPVLAVGAEAAIDLTVKPPFDAGTLLGKRYTVEGLDLELLCTKAGTGSLSLGDTALVVKSAKPLPSSD